MQAMKPSAITELTFPDAASAAQALAEQVAACIGDDLARQGSAAIAVSGGRSPVPFFEALSRVPLEWSRVWITLVDERWVPPDTADSNERLVRTHLLINHAASAQFVPLFNAAAHPQDALCKRGAALAALPSPYSAIVLGMGEDGHTASLFPGADGLAAALDPDGDARLVAMKPLTAPHWRISLSFSALLQSRQICLLLGGPAKRAVYRQALNAATPLQMPVAAVLHQQRVPVSVYMHA